MVEVVVVGGGPAGLMAAETLAREKVSVLVADAMPSLGRKFLMAGKSGLNLTKAEPFDPFLSAYGERADWLAPILRDFGSEDVQAWAERLGQPLFAGSTGRVFPQAMKASPLLRAWLARLRANGVAFSVRWRWTGWDDAGALCFDTPDGPERVRTQATVLALGGASWSRLGSDGTWAGLLAARGVPLAPFAASNVGLSVPWSPHMAKHSGTPVKAVRWCVGDQSARGEAVVTDTGLEGGGLYPLVPAIRGGAALRVDLVPDVSADRLEQKLEGKPAGMRLSHWLRNSLRLPPVKIALFNEAVAGHPPARAEWVRALKAVPIAVCGLRPLDDAISTAGGVQRAALTPGLALKTVPAVWCAGEMLDWDAPTGGYLLTACLATGRWAGRAVLERLQNGAR